MDYNLLILNRKRFNQQTLNKKDVLINSVMGLCGESGEAATALEVPLEDIFQANIDKLKKRYPDGFQTEKSLVRLRGDV